MIELDTDRWRRVTMRVSLWLSLAACNILRAAVLLITHVADKSVADELAAALHGALYEVFSLSFDAPRAEDEDRIARLAAQVDAAIVLFAPAEQTWAQTMLGTLQRISTSRYDQRPTVRAILFRGDAGEAPESFRSHYYNLVLTGKPSSWDGALEALRAELHRTPPP
jgi:hypothetical protein